MGKPAGAKRSRATAKLDGSGAPAVTPAGGSPVPRKLVRPSAAPALVRKRLFQRLDRAGAGVTWLHARAGAGKTLLLASYLEARAGSALWITVDVADRDVGRLFHYADRALEALLGKRVFLPSFRPLRGDALRAFTRHFFELLFARLPPGCCVVFDDLHEALDDPAYALAFREVCAVVPEHVRLLVASRRGPPPSFARLVATGSIALLPGAELRFDLDEIQSLVTGRADAASNGDGRLTGSQILEWTEGWAVAVGLLLSAERTGTRAARPPQRRARASAFLAPSVRDAVFDFLATEVIEHLEPEAREFLFEMALLPSFDLERARAVSGRENLEALLGRLSRDLLLLERDDLGRFRIHDLLREMLLKDGRRHFGPARERELLVRSAHALAESDDFALAFELLARAEDWPAAIALIERCAPALAASMQLSSLQSAIERIPVAERTDRHWLTHWHAVSLLAVRPDVACTLAAQAFEGFVTLGDAVGKSVAWIVAVHAVVFFGQDYRGLQRWLDHLAHVRSEPLEPMLEGRLAAAEFVARAYCAPMTADTQTALAFVLNSPGPFSDEHGLVVTSLGLFFSWLSVDRERARVLLNALQERTAREPDNVLLRIISLQVEGMMTAWLEGNFDLGARAAHDSSSLSRMTGLGPGHLSLGIPSAQCLLIRGEATRARELIHALRIPEGAHPALRGTYVFTLGFEALERGDLVACEQNMTESLVLAQKLGFDPGEVASWVGLSFCAASAGNAARAEECLEGLRATTQRSPAHGLLVGQGFAQAYAELCFNGDAHATLFATLREAEHSAAIPLVLSRRVMRRLLIAALEYGLRGPATERYIRSYALAPAEDTLLVPEWPWPIRLRTLGGFALEIDGQPVTFGRKLPRVPLALLQLLAAHAEPLPTERVLRALWPGYGDSAPRAALDTAVYRLRRLLKSDAAVEHAGKSLSLSRTLCWSDARALHALAAEVARARAPGATPPSDARLNRWESLLGQWYRGPFAPHEDVAALVRLRVRSERTYQHLVRDLAALRGRVVAEAPQQSAERPLFDASS